MTYIAPYHGKPCLEENQGAITEEDAAFLYGLALAVRPTCIAEVGTGWLRSLRAFHEAAAWMLENLNWECQVWSCDISLPAIEKAHATFPSARLVYGTSKALAEQVVPPPEIIFIDAEHTYGAVKSDYETMLKVAAKNAIFIFHDTEGNDDLRRFCTEIGCVFIPSGRGIAILTRGQRDD